MLNGEKGAIARVRSPWNMRLPIAWNIPVSRVFSPEATGIQPHQEYEWLSGIIIICGKA